MNRQQQRTYLPTLAILQQNLNKSKAAQSELLHSQLADSHDVVLTQEPYIDHNMLTRATLAWEIVYPSLNRTQEHRMRACILVKASINTETWHRIRVDSRDITAIAIHTSSGLIDIYNIYLDCLHSDALQPLQEALTRRQTTAQPNHVLLAGDFNRHHPAWDELRNAHLFTIANLENAQILINMIADHGLEQILPQGIATLEAKATHNHTRPDNVFLSASSLSHVVQCQAYPPEIQLNTDHFPISTILDLQPRQSQIRTRHNYRKVDWQPFRDKLKERLTTLNPRHPIKDTTDMERETKRLSDAIALTVTELVPKTNPHPKSKRWWTPECAKARNAKLHHGYVRHRHLHDRQHPSHDQYRKACAHLKTVIQTAQLATWTAFIADADNQTLWTVHRFVSAPPTDGGVTRIPALRANPNVPLDAVTNSNAEKTQILFRAFFPSSEPPAVEQTPDLPDMHTTPPPPSPMQRSPALEDSNHLGSTVTTPPPSPNTFPEHLHDLLPPETTPLVTTGPALMPEQPATPLPAQLPMYRLTSNDVINAIRRIQPYKAPGPNAVANVVFKQCSDLLVPLLTRLFRASLRLKTFPQVWKHSLTVALRKPGRADYTLAKSYRPIALLDTMGKLLSSCVTVYLSRLAEKHNLLPPHHFGGRPGRSTSDALFMVTSYIKDQWRKGNVVGGLFLDIKSAFPSVNVQRLVDDLQAKGLPTPLTDWIVSKYTGRTTNLIFDDYTSETIDILGGLDQGDPLSFLLYLFYDADLITLPKEYQKNALALAFADDIVYLATGRTFSDTNDILHQLMHRPHGALHWSQTHTSAFELDKSALVGFTRKRNPPTTSGEPTTLRQPPPLTIDGVTIHPSPFQKYLGVVLDGPLRFHEHHALAYEKGSKWTSTMRRIGKPSFGIPPTLMRRLYKSAAIPKYLYAAEIHLSDALHRSQQRNYKPSTSGPLYRLRQIHRQATLAITGALRTTATDILEHHADLPPLSLLTAQLVTRSVIRLLSLPSQHPLYPHIHKAHNRLVKSHASPLHHALALLPPHLTLIEPPPLITPYTPTPNLIISIPPRSEAEHIPPEYGREIQIFTDGSARAEGVGAAAVAYPRGKMSHTLHLHLGERQLHTVHQAESIGLLLAAHHIHSNPSATDVSIFTDNQATLHALKRQRFPPGTHYLSQAHKLLLARLKHDPRLRIHIRWVPGHSNIPRNETADREANKAANGLTSSPRSLPRILRTPIPPSPASILYQLRSHFRTISHAALISSPRYRHYSLIESHPHATTIPLLMQLLTRPQYGVLTQLRTGHAQLNYHLHRITSVPEPTCPLCQEVPETVVHYMLRCPAYQTQRDSLMHTLDTRAHNIGYLLTHPKAVLHTLRYIAGTRRFHLPYSVLAPSPAQFTLLKTLQQPKKPRNAAHTPPRQA